jgi:hypothetical protein
VPALGAQHIALLILPALVNVCSAAAVPAERDATLRAFNFGILVHSEGGMFAAAFVKFWHFIVLLSLNFTRCFYHGLGIGLFARFGYVAMRAVSTNPGAVWKRMSKNAPLNIEHWFITGNQPIPPVNRRFVFAFGLYYCNGCAKMSGAIKNLQHIGIIEVFWQK